MKQIRPYGRSTVPDLNLTVREIQPRGKQENLPLKEFFENNENIIIAYGISIIDKIISKPYEEDKRNKEDKTNKKAIAELREAIGEAVWHKFIKEQRLIDAIETKAIWDSKIKATQSRKSYTIKGRWYRSFVKNAPQNGSTDNNPCAIKNEIKGAGLEEIAERIHNHIFIKAYSLNGTESRPIGLMEQRNNAITKNFLKETSDLRPWRDEDIDVYKTKLGDTVSDIRKDIITKKLRKCSPHIIAARKLRDVSRRLSDHKSYKAAKENNEPLFALHEAVRETYKRLLKGRKNLFRKEASKDKGKIEYRLPEDTDHLIRLINHQHKNRHINALIRLGKIIHYTASDKANCQQGDEIAVVATHFPSINEVNASHYWGTDGQITIKQNEAFVRVWRRGIAITARTLKDWADPHNEIKTDILSQETDTKEKIQEIFDRNKFDKKFSMIFEQTKRDSLSTDQKKEILAQSSQALSHLRNNIFHFKGLGGFLKALEERGKFPDIPAAQTSYTNDEQEWKKRLIATMKGAHFSTYFAERTIRNIFAEAQKDGTALPLPRLKNLLQRTKDGWKAGGKPDLPPYSTAEERAGITASGKWKNCQYIATKLLYETGFKEWLEAQENTKIGNYINKAAQATTEAANKINKDAISKAESRLRDQAKSTAGFNDHLIYAFFRALTAEVNSEMRDQHRYEPDSETASENAEFIEKFKLDVIALAFADYLKQQTAQDFRKISSETSPDEENQPFNLELLEREIPQDGTANTKPWQASLYFLLHLMPVDEAANLRHQLDKWSVIVQKGGLKKEGEDKPNRESEEGNIEALRRTITLYINMHDAQFSGENTIDELPDHLSNYFESEDLFNRIFGGEYHSENGIRPQLLRGLREMLRFGHSAALEPIFAEHKITETDFDKWKDANSTIEKEQDIRRTMHEEWSRTKGKDRRDRWLKKNKCYYDKVMEQITHHQHLTSHIMLQNHVHLHRLMMAVLARLTDYSGLWERDLYFVLLALLHKAQKTPNDLGKRLVADMEKGEIVKVIFALKDEKLRKHLRKSLFEKIGIKNPEEAEEFNTLKKFRNNFAHFNMLENDIGKTEPNIKNEKSVNLTEEVNKARKLMEYDRKLKNAVSKSVRELLKREGLDLKWKMVATENGTTQKIHFLELLSIKAREIDHLGGKAVKEALHGPKYVAMVTKLFGG